MHIRPFTEDDLAAVCAIEAAAAEVPWRIQQFQSSLEAGNHCSALVVDETVVGFSLFSLVLDEASLLNIAVSPSLQGRGYGRALLLAGLRAMASRGAKQCFLEVRVSNHSAQSLYRSLGFEVVGQRKNYYPARVGREDALVMSRSLPVSFEG